MLVEAMGSLFLVLFSGVLGSLTVSTLHVDEDYDLHYDLREVHSEIEVSGDSNTTFDSDDRFKRNVVSNSSRIDSRLNRSHPETPGGKIFYRDNDESRRLAKGDVTVTRLVHYGIYPSLNITEPIGRMNSTRSARSKRNITSMQVDRRSDGLLNNSYGRTNGSYDKQLNLTYGGSENDTAREADYVRASHPKNSTGFYTRQNLEAPTGYATTPKYRTLYYPAKNSNNLEYKGDPENKGRVRLISVGYYSFNDSRDDVRNFRNMKRKHRDDVEGSTATNAFEPTRWRRDTSDWSWIDDILTSLGIGRENNLAQGNEASTGSETLSREANSGANEELQHTYGYSSNGHVHTHQAPAHMDAMYFVGVETEVQPSPPTTTTSPNSDENSLTSSGNPATSSYPPLPLPLPRSGTVLIQAPPRRINCKPPKRLARGRCRTVW